MSVVSGVVLCTSCVDEELWPRIDAWLVERGFAALARVEEQASGSKHPQMTIGAAGFNYFPEEEFAAFVRSLQWQLPGNVVLVQQHDHRETTAIWSGGGSTYTDELGALRKRVAELEAGLPAAWRALTDEQRYELHHACCRGCGSLDTGCQCWNDE
jgi:hypothetical protein